MPPLCMPTSNRVSPNNGDSHCSEQSNNRAMICSPHSGHGHIPHKHPEHCGDEKNNCFYWNTPILLVYPTTKNNETNCCEYEANEFHCFSFGRFGRLNERFFVRFEHKKIPQKNDYVNRDVCFFILLPLL